MTKIIKGIITTLPVLLALSSNSQQLIDAKPFTLTGNINGQLNAKQAFISYRNNAVNIFDSVPVNNGGFTYNGNSNGPVLVKVIIDYTGEGIKKATDNFSFYVDGTKVNIQSKDSVKQATVKGSAINNEYLEYKKLGAKLDALYVELNARWAKATKEEKEGDALKDSLNAVLTPVADEKKEQQRNYIKAHPGSFFSLLALKELAGSNIDVPLYEPMFKKLPEKVRSTPTGIDFAAQIEKNKLTAEGAIAPDFTQNDTLGNAVKLSSFRGQYVLVDFWASWCGPCRQENPNVVAAYNKYKNKGFTILGVSLDSRKDLWLKAIEADKLYWTQVSDLKYWDNAVAKQYGIRSIPANLLLDKEGKIIARNIRGEELGKTLEKFLH